MAKAKRRIDYAKFPGGPAFELTDQRKAEIEAEEIYGHAIPAEVWDEILDATSRYTIPESALQAAPTLKATRPKLKALLDASRVMRDLFPGSPVQHRDPLDTDLLKQAMPSGSKGNPFGLYVFLLDWMISYTEHVQSLHRHGYHIGFRGSGLWQQWIIELIRILKRNRLPTGTTKEKVLPFVKLIEALQNHMPEECKKYMQSDRGLAEAIDEVKRQARNKLLKNSR